MLGLHLGRDGYQHRAVRDHLRESDINWNLPFSSNIKKERSSLLYADAVYRRRRQRESLAARVNVFLKENSV